MLLLSKDPLRPGGPHGGRKPATADASGINVDACKYVHILIGGALCGLGGAYLSLVYVPYWQDNITAGIGWIAVALVIFSGWHPAKAVLGCYLFGVLKGLAVKFQGVSFSVLGLKVSIASQVMEYDTLYIDHRGSCVCGKHHEKQKRRPGRCGQVLLPGRPVNCVKKERGTSNGQRTDSSSTGAEARGHCDQERQTGQCHHPRGL